MCQRMCCWQCMQLRMNTIAFKGRMFWKHFETFSKECFPSPAFTSFFVTFYPTGHRGKGAKYLQNIWHTLHFWNICICRIFVTLSSSYHALYILQYVEYLSFFLKQSPCSLLFTICRIFVILFKTVTMLSTFRKLLSFKFNNKYLRCMAKSSDICNTLSLAAPKITHNMLTFPQKHAEYWFHFLFLSLDMDWAQ